MDKNTNYICDRLFELQDNNYRDFHAKLMPNIDKERIIGVRIPALRKLAKEIYKNNQYDSFMQSLPHKYYEENNVHACLIQENKNIDEVFVLLEKFLPYVDNWATCDILSMKLFKKHIEEAERFVYKCLDSDLTYTIRFGTNMLMGHFLDEHFKEEHLERLAEIQSDEYYVNMGIAWYFATALAKQYESTLPFIEQKRLNKWVHNKTIQKAIESYRITAEQKDYLRTLKI